MTGYDTEMAFNLGSSGETITLATFVKNDTEYQNIPVIFSNSYKSVDRDGVNSDLFRNPIVIVENSVLPCELEDDTQILIGSKTYSVRKTAPGDVGFSTIFLK